MSNFIIYWFALNKNELDKERNAWIQVNDWIDSSDDRRSFDSSIFLEALKKNIIILLWNLHDLTKVSRAVS